MYCLAPKIKWKNKKGLCYRHNKRQRFPTGFCWDLLNCSMYRFFTGWHIFLSRQCFIIKSDNEPRDSPQNSGAGEKQRTLSKFLGQAVPAVLCRPTFAIFHQGFITTYVEQFDQWRLFFFLALVVFDILPLLHLQQKYHRNYAHTAWLFEFEEISAECFHSCFP